MKKTIFAAIFSFSISLLFANGLMIKVPALKTFNSVNASKPMDLTLRGSNGCSVHIVGAVTYSVSPASIASFSGSVTITGNTGGTNGTMTFSKENKVLAMAFDNQDVRRLRNIKWTGTSMSASYVAILNEAGINNSLIAFFNLLG